MAELNSTTLLADALLRAYWRGENVNDTTANAYNLTNVNSVAFNTGKFSNAFDLGASNTNKYVHVSSDLGLNSTTDSMTVSFWVKLQAEIGSGSWDFVYFDMNTGANRLFLIRYEYNAGTRRILYSGFGTNITYNITLGTTDYHHIACTLVPGGGAIELFVDNVSRATGVSSTGAGDGVNSFNLGAGYLGANFSSALFDDVNVFKKVLSTTEINTLYSNPMDGGFIFMSS